MVITRSRPPWRKILYENQAFPDNYCGPQFLKELRTNLNTPCYNLKDCILGASVLMLHIDAAILFLCVYTVLYNGLLNWWSLLWVSFSVLVSMYFVAARFCAYDYSQNLSRDTKLVVIFVSFGFGLSPVFKSLTETISTDTIYAMVTVVLCVNIIFNHYGIDAFVVSRQLALNGAIFASVCLASRLQSTEQCFTLLCVAVVCFAVWPMAVAQLHPRFTAQCTFIMATLLSAALYLLSITCLLVYILLHIFITFLCPALFLALQTWKSTIHGPWDEAVITKSVSYD